MGLALLAQASLPLLYWDYAFTTAVYLINRLLTSAIQFAVPYTKLFGLKPDYNFLRTFDVLVSLYCVHTTITSSNIGLLSVFFLVTPLLTKAISAYHLKDVSISPRMCISMNIGFLTLIGNQLHNLSGTTISICTCCYSHCFTTYIS